MRVGTIVMALAVLSGAAMSMSTSPIFGRLFIACMALGIAAACSRAPDDAASTQAAQVANPADPTAPGCSANQGEEACAMCCAGNGPAKPIFEAAAACWAACGEKDDACWERCDQQFDQACSAAGAACTAAVECVESICFACEPKEPKEPKTSLASHVRGGNKPTKPGKPKPTCGDDDDDDDDDDKK